MAVNVESAKKDKITLYEDKAGEWRWRRVASNGNIVGSSSEGYKTKEACKDNAERQFTKCDIDA